MASKESLGRVRHFDLVSQQLRLRHLRSISVRNLVPKFSISGECLLDCLLETYFTLHNVQNHQNAIYTSEKIKYSLNPTWASFDPSSWTEQHSTAMTSLVVRIWGGQNEKFQLIIEWEVHLPSLHYLGDQVKSAKYGHNTMIFGLIDGYYGAPVVQNSNEASSYSSIYASVLKTSSNAEAVVSLRKQAIKVDSDQVQPSYTVSSLQRLQMVQKAIQQTQLSVKAVCQTIQTKVESDLKCTSQLSEEEMLKLKIKLLREEYLSKQKLLLQEREEEKGVMEKLQKRELDLRRKSEQLSTDKTSLTEHKKMHIERRESLVKLNAQLNMRRRQLVSELMNIYPIVELQGSKEHLICGVRLPNCESDEFAAMDDDTLSVALGYTCHLVSMVAKFLQLPLRYPMNSSGSRSTVNDFTIEKVQEKDRKFPLYSKGKEGTKFFYGTFLLNKNIAQIRQYNGLGTPNLRNTLPNLKDLLESKFRSSDRVKSAPLTIIRKSPLKRQKNRSSTPESGGSRDSSPQANSKLDDVLLRTMNASAAEAKPSIPDQPAKPDSPDGPEKPIPLDQPVSLEPPVKPALPPKPVLPDQPAKPALPPKPVLRQLEKPVLSTNPALLGHVGKPALPAKPTILDHTANPPLPDSQRKPVLPAPLSAAQLQRMQTAENSPKAANNLNSLNQHISVGLAEENVVGNNQRSDTTGGALHVPSQGTSRRFLEQKRMKKETKSQGNASTTGKARRTFSFKSRKSNSVDKQRVTCESVVGANVKKDVLSNCAENTGDDFNKFEVSNSSAGREVVKKQEGGKLGKGNTSTTNGESGAERKRSERSDLFARPDTTGKQVHGDGMRSKSLFDVEGSLNFDVCENGEIDLR